MTCGVRDRGTDGFLKLFQRDSDTNQDVRPPDHTKDRMY